ncbi:MAG TPA: DUF4382 domain-containing protein [Longimicrobiales bacterium]|nr:DUF4382 domain-containing protein [Longimicrobiales bacterium]
MVVRKLRWTKLLPLLFVLPACDALGPDATGQARLFLARGSAASAAVSGSDGVAEAPLTLSAVESIIVHITGVQVLAEGNDDSAWETLEFAAGAATTVDLMQLPEEGAQALLFANGEVDVGQYANVRLLIDDSATIVLTQAVKVGNTTLPPDTYALRIPSSLQSGLKINLPSFMVEENETEDATLVFDNATAIGTVVVTGNGVLQMSPVLRAQTP